MSEELIELLPHDDAWAERFAIEKQKIVPIFNRYSCQIEHIGSTSVPHLPAKPIIDIAVKVESVEIVLELVAPLSEVSYDYQGEYGLPGRHFFTKGKPREFHLHIVDDGTDHWERWVNFRGILTTNEAIRKEYLELKADLAEKYRFQREKYTEGKTLFIDSVLHGEKTPE